MDTTNNLSSCKQTQHSCDFFDILLTLASIIAIASLLVRQFNEPDTWWQIAIGKDILRNFSIPLVDHYTLAGWNRPYHDSHWLFQIAVAITELFGGLSAVGLIPTVIWGIVLYTCHRTILKWIKISPAAVLICIVALACNYRFIPRPDIVSCLMISVYYLLLQQERFKTFPEILLFGFLQIVWSNSHGLFVIGPFMAGCYLIEGSFRRLRGEPVQIVPVARLVTVLLVTSLCTPFAFEGWVYALKIANEAGPTADFVYKTLEELAPTFGSKTASKPDFWAFIVICVPLLLFFCAGIVKRNIPLARCMITVTLFFAALTGRRNIPIFCLVAAPLLAEFISIYTPAFSLNRAAKTAIALMLLVCSWFPFSGKFYQSYGYDPLRFGVGTPSQAMPTGLPGLLRQIGFSGQIYNNDMFGGFCLYHGYLPLIDGRWEIYDPPTLNFILRAPHDNKLWNALVSRYGISGALLENGTSATQALINRFMHDGSFELIYFDAVSTFWIRKK